MMGSATHYAHATRLLERVRESVKAAEGRGSPPKLLILLGIGILHAVLALAPEDVRRAAEQTVPRLPDPEE